ncbi:MAG: hypothetical protein ACRBF0_16730 [Calditrichia bacterium]
MTLLISRREMRSRISRLTTFILLCFLSTLGFNQSSTTTHADTSTDSRGRFCLQPNAEIGFSVANFSTPDYANQFWFQGDVWTDGSLKDSQPFYCFGNDSLLYAVGYSRSGKRMVLAQVVQQASNIRLQMIHSKSVEIIPHDNRYVFKNIFFHSSNEIRFEVNGVPMRTHLPLETSDITRFGYLVQGKGQQVRFAIPGVKGK